MLKASGQSSESSRHLDLHNDFIICPSFSHGGVYDAQANFVRISLHVSFLTAALSLTIVLFSLSLKSVFSCVFSGIKVSVHFASLHCLFFTVSLQDRSLVIRRNRTNTSMASYFKYTFYGGEVKGRGEGRGGGGRVPKPTHYVPGAHHWELATPILSLCHGIFTDRSIFRLLFPQNRSVPFYTSAHR